MKRRAAANAPRFDPLAQPVRVLRLNKGAHKVPRRGSSDKPDELWLGTAWDERCPGEPDIPVYVRVGGLGQVTAELVCAVVGRALGLPVPEPFLVRIGAGVLPRSRLLDRKAPESLAFASHDASGSTFVQLLRADSSFAMQMLLQWQHLIPVATFDEWLANTDRNFGNILFAAGTLWLIDHAEALGGTQGRLYPLSQLTDAAFTNVLGDVLKSLKTADRAAALTDAQAWVLHPAGALDLADALLCTGLAPWRTAAEEAELLDFIRARLTLAHSLLCQRLGHPQLALPASPNRPAASADGAGSSRSRPASPP